LNLEALFKKFESNFATGIGRLSLRLIGGLVSDTSSTLRGR